MRSLKLGCAIAGWLASGVCRAQVPGAGVESGPTFGVTVVAPFGFCGRVFAIPEGEPAPWLTSPRVQPHISPDDWIVETPVVCTTRLPKFERLQPFGQIYTTKLDIEPTDFRKGFPGVTARIEWFAIEYTARFWIEKPGRYSFLLNSDDGSALWIDERRAIDNDCMHPPVSVGGSVRLTGGIHDMRVGYFQGPRYQVALSLWVKGPGEKWRIFDTNEFRPPANPDDWKYPNPSNLDAPVDPCKAERRSRQLVPRK